MKPKVPKLTKFSREAKRTLLLGTAFLFLSCLLLIAAWGYQASQPVNHVGKNQYFVVRDGATLNQVALDLKKAGIIRNSAFFRLTGRLKSYDNRIKTGEYQLNGAMPPLVILEILKKGQIFTHSVTIPEGFNLEQIAELLNQKGLADKKAFMEQANDETPGGAPGFFREYTGRVSLPGYLPVSTKRNP